MIFSVEVRFIYIVLLMPDQMKIVVASSPRCIKLLRFIRDNLDDLQALDVKIVIVKANTPKIIAALQARGVTTTPTMISHTGKLFVGEKKIYAILRNNIKRVRDAQQQQAQPTHNAAPTSLEEFWNRGISMGDEGNDEPSKGFNNAMAAFDRRRGTRTGDDEQDVDRTNTRRRNGEQDVERMNTRRRNIEEDDNVGEDPPPRRSAPPTLPPRTQNKYSGANDAMLDKMMQEAMLDNMPDLDM